MERQLLTVYAAALMASGVAAQALPRFVEPGLVKAGPAFVAPPVTLAHDEDLRILAMREP